MAAPVYDGTFTIVNSLAGDLTMTAPTVESATAADNLVPLGNGNLGVGFSATSVPASTLVGGGFTFTAVDVSAKKYLTVIFESFSSYNLTGLFASIADGGLRIVFVDGGGSYVRYNIHGGDIEQDQGVSNTWVNYAEFPFFVDMTATPDASSGVMDWSDLVRLECHIKTRSDTAVNVDVVMMNLYAGNEPIAAGGETSNYSKFSGFAAVYPILDGRQSSRYFFGSAKGSMGSNTKTYTVQNGAQIGDGTTVTHFRDKNFNLAFYASRQAFGVVDFNGDNGWGACIVSENRGLSLNLTSSCTLELDNFEISGVDFDGGDYYVDLDSAGAKTLSNGAIYRASYVKLGDSELSAIRFQDCYEVEILAGSVVLNCSVLSSKPTGKGIYFSEGPADYSDKEIHFNGGVNDLITLSGVAVGAYILGGLTAANSVNFHNESAINDITVEIPSGIAYTTSTAGGDIVIVQPEITLTINLPTGITGAFSIHDLDSSDTDNLGTELQRDNAASGVQTFNYAAAKVDDFINIQFVAAGYKRYLQPLKLGVASVSVDVNLNIESNR